MFIFHPLPYAIIAVVVCFSTIFLGAFFSETIQRIVTYDVKTRASGSAIESLVAFAVLGGIFWPAIIPVGIVLAVIYFGVRAIYFFNIFILRAGVKARKKYNCWKFEKLNNRD